MRITIAAINEKGYLVDKKGNQKSHESNGRTIFPGEKPEVAYNIMDAVEIVKTMLSSSGIETITIGKSTNIKEPKIKEERIGK